MDVLSLFISILCHSDRLFHRESCPRLDVVYPGRAWSSSPAYTWHCSLHYFFLQAIPISSSYDHRDKYYLLAYTYLLKDIHSHTDIWPPSVRILKHNFTESTFCVMLDILRTKICCWSPTVHMQIFTRQTDRFSNKNKSNTTTTDCFRNKSATDMSTRYQVHRSSVLLGGAQMYWATRRCQSKKVPKYFIR